MDLGLPSGTKWATCNVGASKPLDYGLYFQWGDTVGYTEDQVGNGDGKKMFAENYSDYKWGARPFFTKYNAYGATLELEDDAAHVNMGGSWHMPTPDQIEELINNTTSTWTIQNGVNGRLFTSKKDASKSIFIPAAGDAWDGSVHNSGSSGGILATTLTSYRVDFMQYLYFRSNLTSLYRNGDRFIGYSVRGVVG